LTDSVLQITEENGASLHAEILTDNNTEKFHGLGMRSHCVSRDDPASLTKSASDSELVVLLNILEPPGDKR